MLLTPLTIPQVLPLTLLATEIRIMSETLNFLKRLEFIKPVQGGTKRSSYILCINLAKEKAHLLILQVIDGGRSSVTHGMLLSSLHKEGCWGRGERMIFRPRRKKRKRRRSKGGGGGKGEENQTCQERTSVCVCVSNVYIYIIYIYSIYNMHIYYIYTQY